MVRRSRVSCVWLALALVPAAACGGSVAAGGGGHRADSGGERGADSGVADARRSDAVGDTGRPDAWCADPVFLSGVCVCPEHLSPTLTVKDAVTGAPICDVVLVSATSDLSLSPGGTVDGQCSYVIENTSPVVSTLTVSAPGYAQGTVEDVGEPVCGCYVPTGCSAAGNLAVSLYPAGGVDGGSPSDASGVPDARASVCPASPPTAGQKCALSGLDCEYGTDPNPYCNDLWTCSGSTWTRTPYGGTCPSPTGTCPAYSTASARGSCSPDLLLCTYPQGTCACTDEPGGLPTSGGPDWFCTPTTAGCPSTRPTLGSACSDASLTDCDYAQCAGGVGEACVDGYWTLAMVACPA